MPRPKRLESAVKSSSDDVPDFEKQRLANIAARDALLANVKKEAQQAGLYTRPAARVNKNTSTGKGATTVQRAKRKAAPTRITKQEDIAPRRTSRRLAGVQADSEVAKRKAEEEYEAAKEADRVKRQRRTDDLALGDIVVNGDGENGLKGLFGTDVLFKGVARPNERTFGDDEINETTDKDLRSLREKLNSLELWDEWEPNRIKITPERIYSAAFHPSESKPIVFMGDKLGNLGIVDASQRRTTSQSNGIKSEDRDGEDVEDGDEDEDSDPVVTTIKPHTRTISAMHTHPSKPGTLFTCSYDSSIRAIDLEKAMAVEIYGPSDRLEDEPVSGIDMSAEDPNVVYFTTLNGMFGRHDTREASSRPAAAHRTDLYQLSEKKIGGFSLNPLAPHYLTTASLDRFMRLWDLRKVTKQLPTLVGEHESRLSVSHAAFNTAGQVATSSYDDTIKIYSFGVDPTASMPVSSAQTTPNSRSKVKVKTASAATGALEAMNKWLPGFQLSPDVMDPEVTIRHNNQTGRWVTILRPQWQRHPQDGVQKLIIGNMNRFVDVYAADGTQLAQLGGDGITAVPAVAVPHPTMNWIAAGSASGKLFLWM